MLTLRIEFNYFLFQNQYILFIVETTYYSINLFAFSFFRVMSTVLPSLIFCFLHRCMTTNNIQKSVLNNIYIQVSHEGEMKFEK